MKLIDPNARRYKLDITSMDETHQEFIELVNRLGEANKEQFIELFAVLHEHTKKHFENENQLMQESRFPAIREHTEEHQRVLGDMQRLADRIAKGNTLLPRAFVKEQLPSWFDLHAQTMDSALAAHLKGQPLNISNTIELKI